MTNVLAIQVSSDPNYEDLIAECYLNDECVMIVNQERGPEQLEVEVLLRADGLPQRIEYDVLVQLLQKAKTRLGELRRAPRTEDQAP